MIEFLHLLSQFQTVIFSMEDQTPTSHLPTDPAGRIVTQSSSTYHPKRSTLDISGTATVATEHPGTKGGPRWAAWQSAEGQDGTAHGEGRPVVCCDVHRLYFWVLSCDPHPFKPGSAERERDNIWHRSTKCTAWVLQAFSLSLDPVIQDVCRYFLWISHDFTTCSDEASVRQAGSWDEPQLFWKTRWEQDCNLQRSCRGV